MKAYIITLAAGRQTGSVNFQAGANSLFSFHNSQQEAESYGQSELAKVFPASDGWHGHQMNVLELPFQFEDEGYIFTYQLEPVKP